MKLSYDKFLFWKIFIGTTLYQVKNSAHVFLIFVTAIDYEFVTNEKFQIYDNILVW